MSSKPQHDIWISSDFHFNHKNILNFTDDAGNLIRPFDNVEDMNEHMIERHNSKVKQGDIFYCLGDVVMRDMESFKKIWPRLNGRKRLVVGNHDDVKALSSGGFFQKVFMWRKMPDFNLVMSHVPLHESSLNGAINVHGHIHQNHPPLGNYMNVSMEYIDYTPVHIEEIADVHRQQQKNLPQQKKVVDFP